MWIFLVICHLIKTKVKKQGSSDGISRLDNLLREPAIFKNEEEKYDFSNTFNITLNGTAFDFLDGEYNTFTAFLNGVLPFMIILGVFLIVWFEPVIWRNR